MKKLITFLFLLMSFAVGSELIIGAGAGYKKPVMELISYLKEAKGLEVNGAFGNLKQVCSQAKSSDMLVVIGDKDFLNNNCDIEFDSFADIGSGALIFITNKDINSIDEIVNFEKIAMPQPKKAIYGIRATQFLDNSGLIQKVGSKMVEVATVPQVSAYILSGDVDGGFVNLTEAIAQKDKIKNSFDVDSSLYEPVLIVAGVKKECNENEKCKEFIKQLGSDKSKAIFLKYGLR